jgi:hypothetical protein
MTFALGPSALILFLTFEWLFIVTKPSATAGLDFGTRLRVLAESPLRWLLPLAGFQAVASLVSILAYPRVRFLGVVPAAVVLGGLMLLLIDNFTYTVFGFGILASGELLRITYAALLPVLIVFVSSKIADLVGTAASARRIVFIAVLLATPTAGVPVVGWVREMMPPPDLSAPPVSVEARPASEEFSNVLLLGIDGLDAEIMSAYGYHRDTTPFIAQQRETTLFFENAFSNSTRTHGSLVTLLTGRLPFSTRVTFPPTVLRGVDARRNLAAILKDRGYSTLQLGIRHYADAEDVNLFGFDAANYRWQGVSFEVEAPAADETDVFRSTVAERVNARLGALFGLEPVVDAFAHVQGSQMSTAWGDERRVSTLERYIAEAREPWFVHLHMLDTHCCNYNPERVHFIGEADARSDLRDSQVLETDGRVRRIFRALERTGRLDRTIVVISSDHTSSWESTQRVPLIMRFPRAVVTGRVSPNVQLADVAPTILNYLQLPIPDWMDGVSLLDPRQIPARRRIFGVSDIKHREGPSGLRLLLDSGPPNYGAAAAMLIEGNRWYELRLSNGLIRSGEVRGHTAPAVAPLSDAEARAIIEERLRPTGFRVENPDNGDRRSHN